ncbi:polyprenyl synthetase family protein, partial [Jatrophihabitans sp.]|uniref:polyprenyl synthetase family protein n=1 Tax=Jatrophihabitans sp. TaxID=1932789 RepID=UPI0030C669EB|nr:geranylgeranyl pyrophosphate synthase [Jatrophihabitans sp.]
TSAEFGGYYSGLDEATVERLRIFGEEIGVAFQLSDDILDIASESIESGKTPGTDLREGIPTLPVLYALRAADPATARLRELVSRPLDDDDDHAEALALLRSSQALVEARATLSAYTERARQMLEPLPDVPARAALATLCDIVIDRTG